MKKRFVMLGVVAVIVCAVLIPPVRAAAESVLSIFRIADVKTIRISVTDLQEMMTALQPLDGAQHDDVAADDGVLSQLFEEAEAAVQPISDISEFDGFPVRLPSALKAETPALYAAASQSQTVTLDTIEINAALSKLGATALVDSSFNGTALTVSTPPVFMAEYGEVLLVATQSIYIDASDAAVGSLYAGFLSIPAIPEDLRIQLAAIDPKTRDIYLPVIDGLGRETSLGGTTGYIYSSGDLAGVLSMLPGFSDNEQLAELQNRNASVLVWLKDGVLYVLAGQQPDSELSRIARSVG